MSDEITADLALAYTDVSRERDTLRAQLAEANAKLAVAVGALEFYADPRKVQCDRDIPDFYDELCFGEIAAETLSTLNDFDANRETTRTDRSDG